ncbi:MAG: hypothetical protein JNG85_16770 [Spirochaetaceae bacterium]|nr:hypothetical protein [Spirochaetaceae bacterium]
MAEAAPEPSAVAEAPAAEPAPVAEAPAAEPGTGVGESDLAASVAQPLAAGFVAFRRELGDWTIGEENAAQNDPESYFAKLALPLRIGGSLRYSFSARSTGKGWVGFGIHVLVAKVGTHRGYGEGSSTLVWLSRDPRGGDPATRLQIYRSRNDVDMSIVDEAATDISALERNRFEIDVDPAAGLLVVRVNDREAYRKTGLFLEPLGDYVVLRALDRAEFSDFRVEALP